MADAFEMWMVCQDGWPIMRGRSKAQAERHAQQLAAGLHGHRAGSRIRAVDITIQRDVEAMQKEDALYTEFKGYRNGGNVTRTHRQW